jgi:hypoxanthine phosphoribosyltransferase
MPLPPHRVLHDERAIAARVEELAADVARALPGREPLLIGLLDGCFVFLADLARALSRHGVEPQVQLMRTSLYGSGTTPGEEVQILHAPEDSLRGRDVLLVDDILDTGRTLTAARGVLARHDPAWLATCVLLDKPARREGSLAADFVGFTVPDEWIVGYGLDLDGRWRALPYLACVVPPPA